MSDFDRVLERLLDDPTFLAALSADPAAALRGYQLTEDEWALLRSQLVAGAGGQEPVENRTTKSGMVGMLGSVAGAFGVGGAVAGAHAAAGSGGMDLLGQAGAAGSESLGQAGIAGAEAMGQAGIAGAEAMGQAGAGSESVGFGGGSESVGLGGGGESIGAAGVGSPYAPSAGTEGFGSAGEWEQIGSGREGLGGARATVPERGPELTDYRPNIDVDGDGRWDTFQAYATPDGGVEIVADVDDDGRVDFVGHDTDRDGLVNSADYDTDNDGRLDTRMYDDDGDGWLDRSTDLPPGS